MRGGWVLVQYTALAWSRRGFPLCFARMIDGLKGTLRCCHLNHRFEDYWEDRRSLDLHSYVATLFSSRDPVRVSRNVKAVLESDFSPAQIATFGELVNQVSPPIVAPA